MILPIKKTYFMINNIYFLYKIEILLYHNRVYVYETFS